MAEEPERNKAVQWLWVFLKFLGFHWRAVFAVLWPLLALNVFILGFDRHFRCLYVVCVMAGYWVTECMPLYITGMLPMFLMPILGIVDAKKICSQYMNVTNALFLSGLFIAISIEHCGLHLRIALCTMLCLGCSPRRLHFGLTLVTMFMSMWLVNSAATAMMCPIIMAVLQELETQGVLNVYEPLGPEDDPDEPPRPTKLTLAYFLSAGYSSTIGGIGTLVGTGTNLTFKGLFEEKFPTGDKIDFLKWMIFGAPCVILMTLGTWVILQFQCMGLCQKNSKEYELVKKGNENKEIIRNVIVQKVKDLGPMNFQESCIGILFIFCVLMWLTRSPKVFKGWGDYYEKDWMKDSCIPFLIVALFMLVPATCTCVSYFTLDESARPKKVSPSLVTWDVYHKKFPWGLLFLLGGGFALSAAGTESGMSRYLGDKLSGLQSLPSELILVICSFIASMCTELTSNVAICNIFIPVLMDMSVAMKIHPLLYCYPAAICCSFSFMMPVGTPPNAIIAGAANIRTPDMMKYGILPKLLTWIIVIVLFPTYGHLIYDLEGTPDWIKPNSTAT